MQLTLIELCNQNVDAWAGVRHRTPENCREAQASNNLQVNRSRTSSTLALFSLPSPSPPSPAAAEMFSRQVLRAARVAAPQRALALRAAPVRSFAAAASSDVKSPVSVFGVDGTYASALVIHHLQ